MAGKVLVAGASGVVGSSAIQEFIDGGWEVISISRRPPLQARSSRALHHLAIDLQDSDSSDEALRALRGVTHVVFAAVSESPGLVEGWQDSRQMETNLSMLRNCLDPIIRGSSLEHVSIMQGTKAYGAHLHPIDIPARERSPRDPHESFYWHQEDYLTDSAARNGFSYTIMRPSMIMGGAYGAAMNLAPVLGAYAAICREEGLPFAFPGGPSWILEAVDSRVLAKAFTWAARAPEAKNQHFNITNGDVFEWRSVWPAIADVLGIETGPDSPRSLAKFLPERSATWDRVVAKYGLRPISLEALLGESHHMSDFLFAYGAPQAPPPAFISTIKIRKAGFTETCDTEDMFRYWLSNLIDRGILPPAA